MIVVAIIAILASIALPIYQQFVAKSLIQSCLQEAKNYTNEVNYLLNDQDDNSSPSAPIMSACHTITNAQGWTVATQQKIIATTKPPIYTHIECDLPNGGNCKVLP